MSSWRRPIAIWRSSVWSNHIAFPNDSMATSSFSGPLLDTAEWSRTISRLITIWARLSLSNPEEEVSRSRSTKVTTALFCQSTLLTLDQVSTPSWNCGSWPENTHILPIFCAQKFSKINQETRFIIKFKAHKCSITDKSYFSIGCPWLSSRTIFRINPWASGTRLSSCVRTRSSSASAGIEVV